MARRIRTPEQVERTLLRLRAARQRAQDRWDTFVLECLHAETQSGWEKVKHEILPHLDEGELAYLEGYIEGAGEECRRLAQDEALTAEERDQHAASAELFDCFDFHLMVYTAEPEEGAAA